MKKPKILIADDDRAIRNALEARLSAWGYTSVVSTDGLGVVRHCHRENVDLMILDDEMPNGDGQAITRMLRNESNVPIIFLSGHEKDTFRSIVKTLPDVYYLSKPIDNIKLHDLLKTLLATSRECAAAE